MSDEKAIVLKQWVANLHHNTSDLHNIVSDVMQRHKKLHQRSTELVEKLRKIGALEIGSDLSKALTACSESCKVIEEARMNMCKSVETHVLTPLHNMHALIKKQKKVVVDRNSAQTKVIHKQKDLNKQNNKSRRNERHIAKQLLNDEKQRLATVELNLAAELVDFETKRTEEFKQIIKQWIRSQLHLHVKAIEELTKAYQSTITMNTNSIAQDVNKKLLLDPATVNINTAAATTTS